MSRFFTCALLMALTACSHATDGASPDPRSSSSSPSVGEEMYEKAKQRKGGQEPTKLDVFNEIMRKAAEETGQIKDYGKPRIVAKGKKPEIVIKDQTIYVDGRDLKTGDSVEKWRLALGKEDRSVTVLDRVLIWDGLGLELLTKKEHEIVIEVEIHINIAPLDIWETAVTVDSQGKKMPPPRQYDPKHAFPGYLELDGFGIDAQTKFWEVRAGADPNRQLRCGLQDCTHPHGSFSDTASLYLRLNRGDEYGTIYEFVISGGETSTVD